MTSGQLTVGDAGTGSLLIDGMDNGTTGQATAFDATVGARAGSQGSVTLDGGELLVANTAATSSTLAVGAGGAGMLDDREWQRSRRRRRTSDHRKHHQS